MRNRLVEILKKKPPHTNFSPQLAIQNNADYLLENGGLFPPVKIGQELWDIHYNKPRKWEVVYLGYNGKEWHINIFWWKVKRYLSSKR